MMEREGPVDDEQEWVRWTPTMRMDCDDVIPTTWSSTAENEPNGQGGKGNSDIREGVLSSAGGDVCRVSICEVDEYATKWLPNISNVSVCIFDKTIESNLTPFENDQIVYSIGRPIQFPAAS